MHCAEANLIFAKVGYGLFIQSWMEVKTKVGHYFKI